MRDESESSGRDDAARPSGAPADGTGCAGVGRKFAKFTLPPEAADDVVEGDAAAGGGLDAVAPSLPWFDNADASIAARDPVLSIPRSKITRRVDKDTTALPAVAPPSTPAALERSLISREDDAIKRCMSAVRPR